MKRHNNKYWKKEKEYISLLMELDRLYEVSYNDNYKDASWYW